MADLRLDVDISDVLKADKALRDFEGRFSDLERAAKRGVASQDKLVAVFDRLDKAGLSLSQVYRSMERDLDSNAKTAARLENEFRDLALSGKSARDSAQAMERAFKQQERAAEALAQAQAEAAARTLDLRRKFQEGYAASEVMQMQVKDLEQAYREGIVTLEQYRQQLDRIRQGQSGFAASAGSLANRMSRSSVAIQQTGYQVGDFLVQVQSGTNAFVAFGQQATQMAGLLTLSLNPKMVILGAALSILIPLGTAAAAMFSRARTEAEDAADGVDDFDNAIKSLDSSLRDWIKTRAAARLGITPEEMLGGEALGKAEENLRAAREELDRLRAAQEAIARMPASPEGAIMGLLFGAGADNAADSLDEAVAKVVKAEERLAILRQKQTEQQFQTFSESRTQYLEQIRLLETIAKFGEDSDQARQVRLEQAIAAENRRIDALVKSGGLTEAQALSLKRSAEQAELLSSQIDNSANSADGLADALRDASSAMQSLVGFSASLDKALAVAAAKVGALREGANAAVAGQIAGMRVDLERRMGEAVGAGIDRGIVERMFGGERGRIGQLEALETQRVALQESQRGSRRGSSGGGANEVDPLQRLQEQIRLEQELLGKTEAQRRVIQALGIDWQKYGQATVDSLVASIEEMDRFNEKVAEQQRLADFVANSFGDAFLSVIDGTKSAKDAFRSMAADIIRELYRVLVVQRMVGAISGALGAGGSAGGFLANLLRRESGGPMMPNQPYLVGERGPELVIPGRSGTVMNADLTNKAMGGESINIVNNINVSGGTDPAAIRMEVAKLMPQITNATKTAVIDARRRGGQMRAAFQ